jgi:hypothetical protein
VDFLRFEKITEISRGKRYSCLRRLANQWCADVTSLSVRVLPFYGIEKKEHTVSPFVLEE